jgi:hypothetical protein
MDGTQARSNRLADHGVLSIISLLPTDVRESPGLREKIATKKHKANQPSVPFVANSIFPQRC